VDKFKVVAFFEQVIFAYTLMVDDRVSEHVLMLAYE
jgi:hypothetical protein